jgi:putative hydrolase of the HAD superfamily
MHLAKPHEKIYAEVLRQADIKPEETLFIDDSKVNLEGAHALGIHGFWNEHLDDWLGVIK